MAARKKRMLVPTDRLFYWAKRDRPHDQSFFRERSRDWRVLIPRRVDDEQPTRVRFRNILLRPKSSRPVWTPWLWVK
jgi:hypothetical protein